MAEDSALEADPFRKLFEGDRWVVRDPSRKEESLSEREYSSVLSVKQAEAGWMQRGCGM